MKVIRTKNYVRTIAILESLVRELPEMADDETPLDGSKAVDVLSTHWDDILEAIMKFKAGK